MWLILHDVYLFVQVTQLERELDSEKKNHEHFKGGFQKATAMIDELCARNAHLEEQLTVSLKEYLHVRVHFLTEIHCYCQLIVINFKQLVNCCCRNVRGREAGE